ncbi:MAG: hypothetical protein JOZ29_20195, partial [Deltaproteobacteria bacterium]|nr:hypothetical protein [Deltaproteobacteria bacterium]
GQKRAFFDPLAFVKRQLCYFGLDLLETNQALMSFDIPRDQQGGRGRRLPNVQHENRRSGGYGGKHSH